MTGRTPLAIIDIQVPEAERERRLTHRLVCGQLPHQCSRGIVGWQRSRRVRPVRVSAVARCCSVPTTIRRWSSSV